MSKLVSNLKTAAIALGIGTLIALLLYAIENLNLTGRKPMQLDIAGLSHADTRKELLQEHSELAFACSDDKSGLGETMCHTELKTFNGLPARYMAFFFDADDRLTAFKLAAYARAHEEIIQAFGAEFGPPQRAPDAPVLGWRTGSGLLTMAENKPEGPESTVLWIGDPAIADAFAEDPAPPSPPEPPPAMPEQPAPVQPAQ